MGILSVTHRSHKKAQTEKKEQGIHLLCSANALESFGLPYADAAGSVACSRN
jgi:hypothetical protein